MPVHRLWRSAICLLLAFSTVIATASASAAVELEPSGAGRATASLSLDPRDWLGQAGDTLNTFVSGRTPRPACKGGAHSWASLGGDTDMVHRCLINNDDKTRKLERVEVQLTSNRGAYVEVSIPAPNVDFVWVENQPDGVRSLLAQTLGYDPGRVVLLAPGQRMTIGLRRPAVSQQSVVTVTPSNRALLLSSVSAVLSTAGLTMKDPATLLWAVGHCAAEAGINQDGLKPETALKVAQCVMGDAAANLADPKKAAGAAADILGPKATKGELADQTKRLVATGKRLVALGFVAKLLAVVIGTRDAIMASWSGTFDNLAILMLNGTGISVTVDLQAPKTNPSVPVTPTPSALAVSWSENPFRCDGGSRTMGVLSGARAGERITFSSPQVSGLLPGTANAAGRLTLRWQCTADEAGHSWTVTGRTAGGAQLTFVVQGVAPAVPQQPAPQQPSTPQPAPQQPSARGFTIEDAFYGGTWARRDPGNGAWYPRSNKPANAAYWFPNGLGVGVDCARSAASYQVVWVGGRRETWTWWAHVTDDTWVPVATLQQSSADGDQGLAHC